MPIRKIPILPKSIPMGDVGSAISAVERHDAPGFEARSRPNGPVRRSPMSEEAYRAIKTGILTNRYPGGYQVLEDDLARSLGMSRLSAGCVLLIHPPVSILIVSDPHEESRSCEVWLQP